MTAVPRLVLASAALCLQVSLAAPHAAAQSPQSPPQSPQSPPQSPQSPPQSAGDDTARARALFDAGARAYESGQFEAAIQAFEQARAISPRDGLLFSLAQAHRKQHAVSREPRNLASAVDLYRKYLANVKEGARRKDAAEALEQLEPLLAAAGGPAQVSAPQPVKRATIVQISSSTPGAVVSIDGGPPLPAPLTREVTPGVHKVVLSAPGFHDEEQTVEALADQFLPFAYPLREKPARLDVRGHDGADVAVDGRFVGKVPFAAPLELPSGRHFVTLEANGYQSSGAEIALERGESRAFEADLRTTSQRDASWIVMVSGVSVMIAGGAFGVIALAREGDAQEVLDLGASRRIAASDVASYEAARADRDSFATASIATLAGGGLVTLVGLGLYVFDSPDPVAAPPRDGTSPGGPKPGPIPGVPALELGVIPKFGPRGVSGSFIGRF